MSDYLISVVIPTYNTGYYLTLAVDSIINQTIGFENLEIIFVDDNSDDKYTINILKEYDDKYTNCKVIFLNENSGFGGRPRNIGLKNSTAKYIIFMDSDDTYVSNAFETMYNKIIEEKSDFIFTTFTRIYEDREDKVLKQAFLEGENFKINSIDENPDFFRIAPSIWTKIFNKDFLIKNQIRFLEGIPAQDLEFYIHCLLCSKNTVYMSKFSSYNYNVRDSENNKSVSHIYDKNHLNLLCNSYLKTSELLENYNKDVYFPIIFKSYMKIFLNSIIKTTASNEDKIFLIKNVSPLLKKQLEYTPDFLKNVCAPFKEPLFNDEWEKVLECLKHNYKARLEIKKDLYYEIFYKNDNYNTLRFDIPNSDVEFLIFALIRNKKIYSRCSITDIKSDFNITKIGTTTAKNPIEEQIQVFNIRYPTYRIYGDFSKGTYIEITFTINELSPFMYNTLAENIKLNRENKKLIKRKDDELRDKYKNLKEENKELKRELNYYNGLMQTKPYKVAGFIWNTSQKLKNRKS